MSKTDPTLSVLVSARKNSKYLAKFITNYLDRTSDLNSAELLIMVNEHDTWNEELIAYFQGEHNIRFFTEDLQLGRGGLHTYFNKLLKHAGGEWVIYFCEDHSITMHGWDTYVRSKIYEWECDPKDVWCLIPKFENVGAMNQILSRGYINALGGRLGRHGNIDSYINDVNLHAFGTMATRPNAKPDDRVKRFDDEMFYDFTHDQPSQLDDSRTKTELSQEALLLPEYDSPMVERWVEQDAERIRGALIREGMYAKAKTRNK